jgi:DNA-binding transcriptional LysR family regulator
MGVAALPHILAQDDPELTCVADGPETTREIWLVVHPDLRRSARVRVVMNHLVAITAPLRS